MDTGKKNLAETGELAFIERIRTSVPRDGGFFVRSVGDDCLVTQAISETGLLATTDTFVDTVHFAREYMTFEETGSRCMAASVSDIAAMAGTPLFSLVSLSMPKNMAFDDAVGLFRGLADMAQHYGCPVAGGETTSTPGPVTVTITVIGKTPLTGAILRSGAQPGDGVYATGHIGDAMAGLEAFLRKAPGFDALKRKFVAPEARITEARMLAELYCITAMIDISDGIATDIGHICDESGCGVVLDAGLLPLSDDYRSFAGRYGLDMVSFALTSGEEFELLFASNDSGIPERFMLGETPVARIGTIVPATEGRTILYGDGTKQPLSVKGYEHFKS